MRFLLKKFYKIETRLRECFKAVNCSKLLNKTIQTNTKKKMTMKSTPTYTPQRNREREKNENIPLYYLYEQH